MPDTAATQFVAMKFALAMSIGESLEIDVMARRFMVPLLQAVKGVACQLWLRGDDGYLLQFAYPARSQAAWSADAAKLDWVQTVAASPPGPPRLRSDGRTHLHALAVGTEGWIFVECAGEPIPSTVLDAIGVVLVRLASACRACHQHARARRSLADKEMAEFALQQVNARMAEILALSSDGFANFDAGGQLAFHTPQAASLLGLPLADGLTLARIDGMLAPRLQEPLSLAAMAAATADTGGTAQGRLVLSAPQPRTLAFTLQRAADDARTVLHLRDVTREFEVDRLKSEFLATAAHELRTPMVSVFGFTELLLTRGSTIAPDRQRRMLETMHRQSSLLIDLINQLLDLARIEARRGLTLERRPQPLGPLVTHTVESLVLPAGREPAQVHLHALDVAVDVDAGRFHRALLNVLGNAFKYSPDGGPVTLDTREGDLDGRRAVAVRVTDRGIGMTPAQLGRVFERFYRADDSGHIPGSGLGMSLVKEILDLHGGRVDVASTPGEGTEVTLWWPIADEPVPATEDAERGSGEATPA